MPRYYFSLHDNDHLFDDDGIELRDLDAAREYAAAVAYELMFKRDGMLGRKWSQWIMAVRDSNGQDVLSFVLSDFEGAQVRVRNKE